MLKPALIAAIAIALPACQRAEPAANQAAAAELTDPVLRERLLTSRNANWAGWIEQRLEQPGTVFIAVGAGHLAGEGSVQDHLRERDLKVSVMEFGIEVRNRKHLADVIRRVRRLGVVHGVERI